MRSRRPRLVWLLFASLVVLAAGAGTAHAQAEIAPGDRAPTVEPPLAEAPQATLTQRSRRAGRWLVEHLITDVAVTGGWRASWADDARAGFLAQALGLEVALGLEFGDGYAVVGGARVLAGTSNTTSGPEARAVSLEALGHLGFQLRVTGLLRLGLGAETGLLRRWPQLNGTTGAAQDALLLGGYLRAGVDFLPRPNAVLLRALTLFLRLDIAGPVDDPSDTLPRTSLGLCLGLGFRL